MGLFGLEQLPVAREELGRPWATLGSESQSSRASARLALVATEFPYPGQSGALATSCSPHNLLIAGNLKHRTATFVYRIKD